MYTQYPVIRNGHIRQTAEISGNFRKKLLTQRLKFKKHNETIKKCSLVTIPCLRNDRLKKATKKWSYFSFYLLGTPKSTKVIKPGPTMIKPFILVEKLSK